MPDALREMDLNLTPATVAVFGLVFCVWGVVVLLFTWRRVRVSERVRRRLTTDETTARTLRLWRDGQDETITVQGQAGPRTLHERLRHAMEDAGWQHTPMQTVVLSVTGVMMLAFVLGVAVTGSALAGLLMAAGALLVMWVALRVRIDRQRARFDNQFLDALGLAARSLRAGHPLMSAFRLIAQQIDSPVGTRFAEMVQQQEMGVSLEDALHQAAHRSRSSDFRLFAASVTIQLRTGGNLAEMMDRLAHVIRDRMRLSRRVRVLTAQTQLSKRILLVLPILLLILLSVINPGYIEPLYATPPGRVLLAIGAASMMLGTWIMGRLAVLRY